MLTDTFREALGRYTSVVPFNQFVVELATRERIIVFHPEAVVLFGELVKYNEPRTGEEHFFDATSVVQVMSMRTDEPVRDLPF